MKRSDTNKEEFILAGLDSEGIPDEENPEWTEEDFRKAKRFNELPKRLQNGLLSLKKTGRPKKDDPKKQLSLRLSGDIVDHLKNDVPLYNVRVEKILRAAMETGAI